MPTTIDALRILASNLYDNIDCIPGSSIVKDYVKRSYQNDPFRVALEALLLFFALKYMTTKKYQINSNYVKLTKKEIDELVDEWKPEPLVVPLTPEELDEVKDIPVIARHDGLVAHLPDGKTLQTWSGSNFINLHNSDEMKSKCLEIVKTYGVGTCGPSGFYGTMDIHLELQNELARILDAEAAIIYAQGYSAVASVIPAFSKSGDVIVADEGVNFAIQRGLILSKSHVHYFKHNDMEDLERILIRIDLEHKKKKTPLTRRFIVAEGLYQNSGSILPLPEIVALKRKYKYRLIVDESLSFGTLGKRCRGITDYYNMKSSDVEAIVGSLSGSLGSAGGFCVGDKIVIDHQVLSSQAYCYSASLPAFLAAAAIVNLSKLSQDGKECATGLARNVAVFRKEFSPYPQNMELAGFPDSPMVFLTFCGGCSVSQDNQRVLLKKIVAAMREKGVLLSCMKSAERDERLALKPMIKIAISSGYSEEAVVAFAKTLLKTAGKIVKN